MPLRRSETLLRQRSHAFAALRTTTSLALRAKRSGARDAPLVHGLVPRVAKSLFRDHVATQRLGMTTVWIDRGGGPGAPRRSPALSPTQR